MLKKLFVHEWKDTWKLLAILNGVILLLGLTGTLLFRPEVFDRIQDSGDNGAAVAQVILVMTYFFIYFVGMVVVTVGVQIYFFVRFYKQLYTDEGYLMHTLPVTGHQLILSKTFVAMIWRVISTLVVMVSGMMILVAVLKQEAGDFFDEIGDSITDMDITNGVAVLLIVLIILGSVAGMLFQNYTGYLAISIGQQIGKNKVLSSIGIYIGLQFLINLVTNIATQTFSFSLAFGQNKFFPDNWEPSEGSILLFFLVLDLIMIGLCVGMYFLIHHFMSKKLNLD